MTPPDSIKGELNAALIGGIRQRGSEAVGMVIMGIAKLMIGGAGLAVVFGVVALFGFEMPPDHLTGIPLVVGLLSWWTYDGVRGR